MAAPDGLTTCTYRISTAAVGIYFCRHRNVHTDSHLVDPTICRMCSWRETECFLPRPVPADPLKRVAARATGRRWDYISLEHLVDDVRELASRLPSNLQAVAGIPRSGMIPASILAALLHLPLYEVNREVGLRPSGHGLRLEESATVAGPILVIDDSVYGGIAMRWARETLDRFSPKPSAIYAAVYPRPEAVGCLDLFGRPAREPHLFEWNLFNCRQTRTFAFDMDGVICHDWPGGNENGPEYRDFLENAKPRWLPRRAAIPLIVTARLEKYRAPTVRWLRRYGVRVKQLVMGPWESTSERRQSYNAGKFKGRAYAESRCTLFIESDERQAEAIFRASDKPVLCPSTGRVFQ